MIKIHQLVPALHDGDAIGDSARALRDYLRSVGYSSDIYAYDVDEGISDEAINFRTSPPRLDPTDVLILHFALPSGMTEFLKQADCRKAIVYHNITPAYFWLNDDPALVRLAVQGRNQLASLAPFVERSAGDSEYNRRELEQLGYRSTCVLPIFVNPKHYGVQSSRMVLESMQDGLFNLLFVGRVAPNKKLEDVIKVYFYYKRMYDPLSRVVFVGKTNTSAAYYAALKALGPRLGFMPEDIRFTGYVDWSELVAYYKSAHVFLSMSEHEGFCVPLVEAMICETPIIAYSSTAIPYTLGNAGVQVREKDFMEIAGICHRLRRDAQFREEIIEGQRKELQRFSQKEIHKAIAGFLEPLL